MVQFIARCLLPGAIIAAASLLAAIWLWRDTGDAARVADYVQATFWYVLPSLPMFLLIPVLPRAGWGFGAALAAGCALTVALFLGPTAAGPRLGLRF